MRCRPANDGDRPIYLHTVRDGDSKLARPKHGKPKRFFESVCEMEMESDAELRRMAMRYMGNLVVNIGLIDSKLSKLMPCYAMTEEREISLQVAIRP